MKLKIFDAESSMQSRATLEIEFNAWAKENANYTIVEIHTSANEYRFMLYVFYTENLNPTL